MVNYLEMGRSEEHTSELQSPDHLVCRLLLEKKKNKKKKIHCSISLTTTEVSLHICNLQQYLILVFAIWYAGGIATPLNSAINGTKVLLFCYTTKSQIIQHKTGLYPDSNVS